ncbi:hypothetical protein PUNSTDRAFT_27160, partial [Punctularia strigosozonata HHB-11173 SS5]|uniref:uncharacterized protein n=1 Tax=Punctularia strigosozonata (strain HHB-11173) TaxID=741275 RepID=UPI0004416D04
MVIRDIRTRWNYTHAMIKRAEMLRESIKHWVFDTEEMQGVTLTDKDWIELKHIGDILE